VYRKSIKFIAVIYAALITISISLAWWTDIRLQYSVREHLLPDILLGLLAMPTTAVLTILFQWFPEAFYQPFAELIALSIAGSLQALLLVIIAFRAKY
jgi:hypothetical protein